MRLERFDLRAFGGFTDAVLDLDGPGLQIVYGLNEAGKSTARAAITKFLFGFKHQEPMWDFLHLAKKLSLGALVRTDEGSAIDVIRHKRDRDPLEDASTGGAITPGRWAEITRSLSQESFEALYTFDREQLETGTVQLLESRGALGQTIFAASMGLSALHIVLSGIKAEADALFSPAGQARKPAINSALGELARARDDVRRRSIRPSGYDSARRAWEVARRSIERLSEQQRAWLAEKDRVKMLRSVLQSLAARRAALEERSGLDAEGSVAPLGWADRVTEALGEHDRLVGECSRTEQALEQARTRLADVHPDDAVLASAEAIGELVEMIGGYTEGGADRGKLEKERDAARVRALTLLGDLTHREADDAALEGIRSLLALRSDLTDAREAWLEAGNARADAETRAAECVELVSELTDELGALPAPVDPEGLRAVVEAAIDAGDLEGDVDEAQERLIDARSEFAVAAAALGLDVDATSAALAASGPSEGDVDALLDDIEALERKVHSQTERAEEASLAAQAREQELSQLLAEADLPETGALEDARARRARLWGDVKRAWIDGEPLVGAGTPFPDSSALAAAHETAAETADDVADALLRDAERTARRAQLAALIDEAHGSAETAAQEAAAVEGQIAARYEEWRAAWPSQRLPNQHSELRRYLGARADAQAASIACDRAESMLQAAVEKRERHRNAIAAELHALEVEVAPDESFAALRNRSRTLLASIDTSASKRSDLAGKLRKAERTHPRVFEAFEEAKQEEANKRAALADLLGPHADQAESPEAARTLLRKLEAIAGKVEECDSKTGRIEGIDRRLASFETKLANLLEVFPELAETTPATAVRTLDQRLTAARNADATRTERQEQVADREGEFDVLSADLAGVSERLGELAREQEIAETSDLEKEAGRARQAAELDGQIAERVQQVRDLAPGSSPEALAEEIADRDVAALDAELRNLDAQIDGLKTQEQEAREEAERCRDTLQGMERGEPASDAAARAEEARGRILEASARYTRLVLAHHLAAVAIARYREEHQDPLLRRASVILSELTDNRYQWIAASDAGSAARLAVVETGGGGKFVEQLSYGTRDQLYFALRLAALEQAVEEGGAMPVVLDDVLLNFDDLRAPVALRCLAAFGAQAQVLLFTHHRHVVEMAQNVLRPDCFAVRELTGLAP